MDSRALGRKLAQLRSQAGLSQTELAKAIGCGISTISMIERGERNPGFELTETIADYFNVDINLLLNTQVGPHEIKLLMRYQELNEQHRLQLEEYAEFLISLEK